MSKNLNNMRIGITSTQNNGKTTLVKAIQQLWPMYKTPARTYRDIIKEQNLPINQEGTQKSQEIIREALRECAKENANEKYMVHDRTILDNLAYTVYLAERNQVDNDFLVDTINMTRDTMQMFDIIFWLPLNPNIQIEEKEQRSTNKEYREEIDFLFDTIYGTYKEATGLIFPLENCPAVIPLEGDLNDKLKTIREYINDNGDLVETEKSVFSELGELYDQAKLLSQVKEGK